MIIKDLRPIQTVECDGFKALMAFCEPSYVMPGRKFFTSELERLYKKLIEKLKMALEPIEGVSLTSDIWTSSTNESYLSLTVHFIDHDWQMKHCVLTTLPLDAGHNGENIASWLLNTIASFQLSPDKVVALVHDNGSNMVAAANKLSALHGWASVRCAAHTLQLVINAALKCEAITETLTAARKVVEHFKRSVIATSLLHEKQHQMSIPENQLVQDVSTRWNSSLYMTQRLLQQRWPVSAVLNELQVENRKKTLCKLSDAQWEMLEALESVLTPFETATVFVSGESYVTVSSVSKIVMSLSKKMQRSSEETDPVSDFKRVALKQLNDRWPLQVPAETDRENNKVCETILKATALDPRYKLHFLSTETANHIQRCIIEEANRLNSTSQQTVFNTDLPVESEITVATTPSVTVQVESEHNYG